MSVGEPPAGRSGGTCPAVCTQFARYSEFAIPRYRTIDMQPARHGCCPMRLRQRSWLANRRPLAAAPLMGPRCGHAHNSGPSAGRLSEGSGASRAAGSIAVGRHCRIDHSRSRSARRTACDHGRSTVWLPRHQRRPTDHIARCCRGVGRRVTGYVLDAMDLRNSLRARLTTALRERDRVTADALRSVLRSRTPRPCRLHRPVSTSSGWEQPMYRGCISTRPRSKRWWSAKSLSCGQRLRSMTHMAMLTAPPSCGGPRTSFHAATDVGEA